MLTCVKVEMAQELLVKKYISTSKEYLLFLNHAEEMIEEGFYSNGLYKVPTEVKVLAVKILVKHHINTILGVVFRRYRDRRLF